MNSARLLRANPSRDSGFIIKNTGLQYLKTLALKQKNDLGFNLVTSKQYSARGKRKEENASFLSGIYGRHDPILCDDMIDEAIVDIFEIHYFCFFLFPTFLLYADSQTRLLGNI